MKKNIILITLLITVFLVAGCTVQSVELEEEIELTPVSVEKVKIGSVSEKYYGIGQLSANEEFDVFTGQPGTIEGIEVEIGDTVKKDQILFQLDNYKLYNQIGSQESQLKSQKDAALIQLNDVQRQFDQTKVLHEAGAVSKYDIDQATDRLNQATISYQNASTLYITNMKALNDDLSDTYVKSPIMGTIAAVYVEEGEEVENITAMKVINSNAMKAVINVPEKTVRSIKIGQKVDVWFNGDKNNMITGDVTKIDMTTQQAMSLYPVEITVENKDEMLMSGMFIEAEIYLQEKKNTVVISSESVLNDGENDYVFIADKDVSKKMVIKKGIESEGKLEVIAGIESDKLIIVRGHDYLDGGEMLQIVD